MIERRALVSSVAAGLPVASLAAIAQQAGKRFRVPSAAEDENWMLDWWP